MRQKTIGILGGGISALSTAYYLRKKFGNAVKSIIFEKSSTCGGWIKTISRTDGSDSFHYEQGPRTIRPAKESGMNTLDLVEELGIADKVLYVTADHPAAKNRFIYKDNQLIKLPTETKVLFRRMEPFRRALIFAGLRDLFKFRKTLEDDSIYNFVQRRFGQDVAAYIIDPLIRGICAGDAKQISVKFLMKSLFEFEQKYGSALLGLLIDRFKEDGETTVGYSAIALASLSQRWSVWTLSGGLQLLPHTLEQSILPDVTIKKEVTVKSVKVGDRLRSEEVEIEYSQKTGTGPEVLHCDYLISAIPCSELGKILRRSKPSHPSLWKLFETMQSADVQVSNVMYKHQVLDKDAFGFLVPSFEPLGKTFLGCVFDTCSFPQGGRTILTIMSRKCETSEVLEFLKQTLGICAAPDDMVVQYSPACIAQYTVGHYEKVDAIRRYVKAAGLPLSLVGSGVDGVSVNDAIYSGKKFVDDFEF